MTSKRRSVNLEVANCNLKPDASARHCLMFAAFAGESPAPTLTTLTRTRLFTTLPVKAAVHLLRHGFDIQRDFQELRNPLCRFFGFA